MRAPTGLARGRPEIFTMIWPDFCGRFGYSIISRPISTMRISATPISVISPAVTIAAPMRLKLQYMFRVLRYEGEKPKLSSNPKGWLWQCAGRNPQLLFVAAEPVQVRCLGAVAAQTAVCRLASGGTFRLSRPVAGCDTVETRADDQEAVVAAFAQDLAGTASRSVGLSFERGDVGDLVGSHAHDRAGRSAGWQAVGSTRGPRPPSAPPSSGSDQAGGAGPAARRLPLAPSRPTPALWR